jgi:hypothetical protein
LTDAIKTILADIIATILKPYISAVAAGLSITEVHQNNNSNSRYDISLLAGLFFWTKFEKIEYFSLTEKKPISTPQHKPSTLKCQPYDKKGLLTKKRMIMIIVTLASNTLLGRNKNSNG